LAQRVLFYQASQAHLAPPGPLESLSTAILLQGFSQIDMKKSVLRRKLDVVFLPEYFKPWVSHNAKGKVFPQTSPPAVFR